MRSWVLLAVVSLTGCRAFVCPPAVLPSQSEPNRATPRQLDAASDFGGLAHAGVLVSDTQASKDFYTGVLGFEDVTEALRPNLPFKGAFMQVGPTQLHLMELPNPDPTTGRPEHGGRDRHIALLIRDLAPLKARLDEAGVTFTMSKSGRAALFCRDLDGNALEFIQEDF